MNSKNLIRYCLVIAFFCSCSTEKNTILRRGFHNLHAKYNGYYNANEIIKQTYSNFKNTRKENYNKILPVFIIPNNVESKNWYSQMDTAASKCELVIYRHRMPHAKKGRNRNKEWCKWIDDNWMTIAITKYYKRDFAKALKIFQYIENHYPTENSYYQSLLWQAKVLIEMESYDEAEEILLGIINKREEQIIEVVKTEEKIKVNDKLKLLFNYEERKNYLSEQEQEISLKLIQEVYPILADLQLRKERNDLAIVALEQAIEFKLNKEFKSRLIYILAQLYHKDGNYKASTYYQQVVERNPEYEMAFQAKINRALSFSGGETKAIKAQLIKMLKDDKNIDYFDQIYYALAEIAFKDGQEQLGLENLQTSINVSKGNIGQKVKSMRKMGDLSFNKYNYENAYHYYDSISKIIPPEMEDKPIIEKQYKLLKKIYFNLKTVNLNDSLFRICAMDEQERSKKIFEVVDILEAANEKTQESDLLANKGLSFPSSNSAIAQSIFLWDESMMTRGKNEFDAKWGERRLEDNWRRASKAKGIIGEEDEEVLFEQANGLYEKILQSLPCEQEDKLDLMKDSNLIALFNLGKTHHYETENLVLARIYFKRIVANYQENKEAVASAYELYVINKSLNNSAEREEMKELILSKYPNSKYAKLILGDGGLNEQEKRIKKEKKEYKFLFEKYKLGDYNWVIDKCNEKIQDSLNPIYCDYGLLMAYAQGKNRVNLDTAEIIKTLKIVTQKCIGTSEGDQAMEILKLLKINQSKSSSNKNKWKYTYEPDEKHYFILFVPKGDFDMNKAKNNVADFNMSSFSEFNLKTSNKFLNTSDQMILVKSFPSAKQAMDYYIAFKVNNGPVKKYKKKKFFVLSTNNMKELYLEKKVTNYLLFFNEFYL